jgi:hypothetical protein
MQVRHGIAVLTITNVLREYAAVQAHEYMIGSR